MIYLDNAATTLRKAPGVAPAMLGALEGLGNYGRGLHSPALEATRLFLETRRKIARLLGVPRPDHVIFTRNATEALNMALMGMFDAGDHIISTVCEHNSVLRPLNRLQDEHGIEVDFVEADAQGNLRYEQLETLLRPCSKALVCTHASNLTGNVSDLALMGDFARRHGLKLVVDASQTAGCYPLNMAELGIDVLACSGHKGLLGPQGVGVLCLSEDLEVRPWLEGGTGVQSYCRRQPREYPLHLEAGTQNAPGVAGLGAAVDYVAAVGVEQVAAHERELLQMFVEGVGALPDLKLYGDFSRPHVGIVSLNIADVPSGEVADALFRDYGIAVRPGAHCAPRMHLALGTEAQGAVRFSFSWFTTKEEITGAVAALEELCRQ